MSKFKELYNADIARYGGKPEVYIRIFHYLYRKAAFSTIPPIRLLYKVLFRLWANRRGLEISANKQIGGGCPKTYYDSEQQIMVTIHYACKHSN